MKLRDLDINIHDNFGYWDLPEVITGFKKVLKGFDTHAMSDHTLYLKGRKSMLRDLIIYLEKVVA